MTSFCDDRFFLSHSSLVTNKMTNYDEDDKKWLKLWPKSSTSDTNDDMDEIDRRTWTQYIW